MSFPNKKQLQAYLPFPLPWALLCLPLLSALNFYLPTYAVTIALILSLLLGLPHGAADPLLAWEVAKRSLIKTACILALYFGLVLLTWFTWSTFDPWPLILFILISLLHFILGSRPVNFSSKLLFGSFSIILPVLFYSEHTAEIFSLLSNKESFLVDSKNLGNVALALLIATSAGYFILFVTEYKARKISIHPVLPDIIECIMMLFAAYFLPPLLFFAWYFCSLHSPLHLRDVGKSSKLNSAALYATIVITLVITAVLAALAYKGIRTLDHHDALIQLTFQGLAALTFPHMLLVGAWQLMQRRARTIESSSP
jgi:beta-carotene 15,15'-dioxygenase